MPCAKDAKAIVLLFGHGTVKIIPFFLTFIVTRLPESDAGVNCFIINNGRNSVVKVKVIFTGPGKNCVGGLYTTSDPNILAPSRKICIFTPVGEGVDSIDLDNLSPVMDEDGNNIEYDGSEKRARKKLIKSLQSYGKSHDMTAIDFIGEAGDKIKPYLSQ